MAEFNQFSFKGGMNLLVDDTRLKEDEYREAWNCRNRFDTMDPVNEAVVVSAPAGRKQGLYTFGDYMLLFVAGSAYYKYRDSKVWNKVENFVLSTTAERVWAVFVPSTTTNYGRLAVAVDGVVSATGVINFINVTAAFGNPPGILVQDGVSQPIFIIVTANGLVARTTQRYEDWKYDDTGVADKREYVPVGTYMGWQDGVLYVVAPDLSTIYRSVSGRPLDFVVNVKPDGDKGGDASTTAFSVGVGGITCLQPLNNGGLFVSAGNGSCFLVTPNRNPGARTEWGEYTFIRQFLFNASALNDRCVVDILGDTAFVDIEGVRSFNAVLQQQNEGRNSIFNLKVASLFQTVDNVTGKKSAIIQQPTTTAAIVYDNYALFSVRTIYGYVIVVYDTLNQCWVAIDNQTGGVAIKQFAKIDIDTTRLYAITTDDRVLELYGGTTPATAILRQQSLCNTELYANQKVDMQNPKQEVRPREFRCVVSRYRRDSTVRCVVFVDNNYVAEESKDVFFDDTYNKVLPLNLPVFSDVNTGVANIVFPFTNCHQGWKAYAVFVWTGGGSLTNISAMLDVETHKNPMVAQANALSRMTTTTTKLVKP